MALSFNGNQLEPASTVRVLLNEGEIVLTDGPIVKAGEALRDYYLIEVADRDAAVVLASRIPALRIGAAIDVRPVVERDAARFRIRRGPDSRVRVRSARRRERRRSAAVRTASC